MASAILFETSIWNSGNKQLMVAAHGIILRARNGRNCLNFLGAFCVDARLPVKVRDFSEVNGFS